MFKVKFFPPQREKNRNDLEKEAIAICIAKENPYFSPLYRLKYLPVQGDHHRRTCTRYQAVNLCDGCGRASNIFVYYKLEDKERCPICFQTGHDFKAAQKRREAIKEIDGNHLDILVLKIEFKENELEQFDRKLKFKNGHSPFIYSSSDY